MTFRASTPRLGIVNLTDVAAAASLGQPGISQLPSVTTEPQFGEIVAGYDSVLGGGEFQYARAATTIVAAQTISSITAAAGVATLTTGSAHGLVPGSAITISGAVPLAYNGTFQVLTVPSTTTLTFATTATAAATTVGTYVVSIGAGQVCELAYTLTGGNMIITATPWTGTANTAKPLGWAVNNMAPSTASWFQVQGITPAVTQGTVAASNPLYWQANGAVSATAVAGKQVQSCSAASANGATYGSGSTAVVLPSIMSLIFTSRPSAQDAIT